MRLSLFVRDWVRVISKKNLPSFLFNLKPLLLVLCIIALSRASLLFFFFFRISPLCSKLSNSSWHHLSLLQRRLSTNNFLTLGLHPISTPRSRIS